MEEEDKRKLREYRDVLGQMEDTAKTKAMENKRERKLYAARAEAYALARHILVGHFITELRKER